jgi:prepilin-type N-terminal cleavage/methylation domain-containing protein
MSRGDRRGFTFVEVLTVVVVIALLSGMMVMRYIELRHRALTARATADMHQIRMAAFSRFYDTGRWPQMGNPGVVPPDLVPYLGAGFSFQNPQYSLEFENFAPPGGGPSASYQIAVRLTTSNADLRNTLAQVVGDRTPFLMLGDDLVLILVGPDGET